MPKDPEERNNPDNPDIEVPISQIAGIPKAAADSEKALGDKEEVKQEGSDIPKYEGSKKRTLETMVKNGDFGTERIELILKFLSTETSKKRLKKLYDKLMPPSYLKIKRDTANTPELLLPIGARLDKVNRYL